MVTASDRNDTSSARIGTYLPQFERASVPDPEIGGLAGLDHPPNQQDLRTP